mgnify:CR=1 FL=1
MYKLPVTNVIIANDFSPPESFQERIPPRRRGCVIIIHNLPLKIVFFRVADKYQ